MGELDFTGLYIPEENRGTEMGRLTAAVISRIGKGCFATAVYISVQYGLKSRLYVWK